MRAMAFASAIPLAASKLHPVHDKDSNWRRDVRKHRGLHERTFQSVSPGTPRIRSIPSCQPPSSPSANSGNQLHSRVCSRSSPLIYCA